MSIVSKLFQAARIAATVRAFASLDPRRMGRRLKNIAIGRAFARLKIWRRLWR